MVQTINGLQRSTFICWFQVFKFIYIDCICRYYICIWIWSENKRVKAIWAVYFFGLVDHDAYESVHDYLHFNGLGCSWVTGSLVGTSSPEKFFPPLAHGSYMLLTYKTVVPALQQIGRPACSQRYWLEFLIGRSFKEQIILISLDSCAGDL